MTIRTLLAGLALGALGLAPASAQEHVFKLHHFLSAKAPAHTRMLEPWVQRVQENSGGAVRIDIYPSMSLGGKPPELIQQARDGVVDIVWTVNGYTPGLFPRTEVFELPTVFLNDPKAANLAMHDMFDDTLREEYRGLEVMWLHVHGGQAIHMADEKVEGLSDFSGKKLRIPSRTGAWIIEALGASPVATPVTELPQALSKKVVDGALIPFEIIPPLRIHQQTEYQIEGHEGVRLGTATFQVSMNKARWDALPDDVKQAFRDASDRAWWAEVGDFWRSGEEVGIGVATKGGNEHVVLDETATAEIMTAVTPVVDRWVEEVTGSGIDGEALVIRARELIARNEGS